jgi:hypothetical protein
MKWSFSLAIELSYCSKHTKSTIFLSYQAFLAYNPKEFLGVITESRNGNMIGHSAIEDHNLGFTKVDRQLFNITKPR